MLKITQLWNVGHWRINCTHFEYKSLEHFESCFVDGPLVDWRHALQHPPSLTEEPDYSDFQLSSPAIDYERSNITVTRFKETIKNRSGVFIKASSFYDSWLWFVEFDGDDKDFALLATLDHFTINEEKFDASVFRNAIQTLRSNQHA